MAEVTSAPVRKTQDWVLQTVRESQKAVVDTVSIWAKVFNTVAPATTSVKLPKQFPTATSIINPTFDLAEKLLEAQRAYVTSLATSLTVAKPPARKTSASS